MGGRVVLALLLQAATPWAWLYLGSIRGDFPIAGDLALLGAFASLGCAVAGLVHATVLVRCSWPHPLPVSLVLAALGPFVAAGCIALLFVPGQLVVGQPVADTVQLLRIPVFLAVAEPVAFGLVVGGWGLSTWWLLRRSTGARTARRPDAAGAP